MSFCLSVFLLQPLLSIYVWSNHQMYFSRCVIIWNGPFTGMIGRSLIRRSAPSVLRKLYLNTLINNVYFCAWTIMYSPLRQSVPLCKHIAVWAELCRHPHACLGAAWLRLRGNMLPSYGWRWSLARKNVFSVLIYCCWVVHLMWLHVCGFSNLIYEHQWVWHVVTQSKWRMFWYVSMYSDVHVYAVHV